MAEYTITNLEFGNGDSPSEFCFDGNYRPGEFIYSPFSMTLISGNGHHILVDTGIDVSKPEKKKIADEAFIQNCHDPVSVLASVGVSAADIDAVFLTHLHFDHAGGNLCFPNAMFYVQKEELDGWKECVSHPSFSALYASVDPEDLRSLDIIASEGRLVLLDGDKKDIFPGISVMGFHLEHSFASQAVVVETDPEAPHSSEGEKGGIYVIAGDIGRYPENYLGNGQSGDFIFNVKFGVGSPYHLALAYERIWKSVKGDLSRIVMTHDGTKQQRYPTFTTQLGLKVSRIKD